MAGWLYCFSNNISDYLLHIQVKQKNFIFGTPKVPCSTCLYSTLFLSKGAASSACPRVTQNSIIAHHDSRFIFILLHNPFKPPNSTSWCHEALIRPQTKKDPGTEQAPNVYFLSTFISFPLILPVPASELGCGMASLENVGLIISQLMLTGEPSYLSSTITYVQTSVFIFLSPQSFNFLGKTMPQLSLLPLPISEGLTPTPGLEWALIGLSQEAEKVTDVAGRYPCEI